ncbi:MAG TPA: hypothetical protein PKD09_05215 [Aggregatilinea sp.]|jgi:hypothetical protein|uniref:hypothetical protein n=1 Tax=Aggregatilinea sp. TaxID=2806333 RepID=UPI002BFF03C7|nr:hypothetical protein [Aggregatilinea sp.]HML21025.1 hypothetical protein [Aggregatilinea sp.]
MIIREPRVHATYYYLREVSGESPARRQARHDEFVADMQAMHQAMTGWLAMPAPDLPPVPTWEAAAPSSPHVILETGVLAGRTNASACMVAHVLRNMLLLHIIVERAGDHEQDVWSMLDASLGNMPTTPSWIYTTRYWCGIASRPPEDLEEARSQPIRTPYGVLCLGQDSLPNLLIYPDARTGERADGFLTTLATEIDWYSVEARHRLETYEDMAARSTRVQQTALDQVAHSVRDWTAPQGPDRMRSLMPLQADLEMLETTQTGMLADRAATEASAREVQALARQLRLALMHSGLWDAAPTVWEARVAAVEQVRDHIEADLHHIDLALQRTQLMLHSLQTRVTLLQTERERMLFYLVGALGLALIAVLVVDSDIVTMLIRLVVLVLIAGGGWWAWQRRGPSGGTPAN